MIKNSILTVIFFSSQFTRDALITISGAKEKKRDFVYFTDVKNIPNTDLATIERLWSKFSGGKFGYSVQKVCLKKLNAVSLRIFKRCFSFLHLMKPCNQRKNSNSQKVILNCFAEKLAGQQQMERLSERSAGLGLRNSSTM